jgi:hypothetical protein
VKLGISGLTPICLKYTPSQQKVRIGLSAQRVPDIYHEDKYEAPEEPTHENLVGDEWGGSQYEPKEAADPNVAPDLGDLIDFDAEEARVSELCSCSTTH